MTAAITHFKRLELKYILTLEQKQKFLKTFKNFLNPDNHGDENGNYQLESMYYDTENLDFYKEKLEKIKNSKKIRIRRYIKNKKNFNENDLVFVEIKEKIENVTMKRRAEMTFREAKNFLEKRKIPKYNPEDKMMIAEILLLASENKLKPKAVTKYSRQAFFGKNKEEWVRISFDTWVFYNKNNLELNSEKNEWKIISENLTIMELKANNEIPKYFEKFFEENNIFPTKMSKYCQAIEENERKTANLI